MSEIEMDIKTLVVGDEVCLGSGIYGMGGEVIKVTPEGVDVHCGWGLRMRFDYHGKQTKAWIFIRGSYWERPPLFCAADEWGKENNSPWELVGMSPWRIERKG
jgi:hypothetical protein